MKKKKKLSSRSSFSDSRQSDRTLIYFAVLTLHSFTSSPSVGCGKHPHNTMLPLPYLKMGMVSLWWCAVLGFSPNMAFYVMAKTFQFGFIRPQSFLPPDHEAFHLPFYLRFLQGLLFATLQQGLMKNTLPAISPAKPVTHRSPSPTLWQQPALGTFTRLIFFPFLDGFIRTPGDV